MDRHIPPQFPDMITFTFTMHRQIQYARNDHEEEEEHEEEHHPRSGFRVSAVLQFNGLPFFLTWLSRFPPFCVSVG